MTPPTRGLETLLAEHRHKSARPRPDGSRPQAPDWNPGCTCGEPMYYFEHAAHVAAAVRAYLLSDAVVERAARDLYLEDENDSMGFDEWPDWDTDDNVARHIWIKNARAALAAAVGGDTE